MGEESVIIIDIFHSSLTSSFMLTFLSIYPKSNQQYLFLLVGGGGGGGDVRGRVWWKARKLDKEAVVIIDFSTSRLI